MTRLSLRQKHCRKRSRPCMRPAERFLVTAGICLRVLLVVLFLCCLCGGARAQEYTVAESELNRLEQTIRTQNETVLTLESLYKNRLTASARLAQQSRQLESENARLTASRNFWRRCTLAAALAAVLSGSGLFAAAVLD